MNCVYMYLCVCIYVLYVCVCVCMCARVSFLPRFSLVCCFMLRKSLPFLCGFLFELLNERSMGVADGSRMTFLV